jgi:hypothetical protein
MIARMRAASIVIISLSISNAISAQQPPAPRKVFTNRPFFSVPLKIEDADRAKIAAIKCYVKPPGGSWMVTDTGNAQTGRFNYQANEDGEYLFSFTTVDSAGRESPASIEREAPRLIVVVDSKPPEFIVAPVTVASGQAYVQCTMKDANPDLTTITAEGELADGTFTPLLPVDTSVPGFFRVPATGMPSRVRVGGKDKAGNATVVVLPVTSSNTTPTTVVPVAPRKETIAVAPPMPKPEPPVAPPVPQAEPMVVVPSVPKLEPISAPTPKNIGSGLMVPELLPKPVANPVASPPAVNESATADPIPLPAPIRDVPAPNSSRVAEKPATVEPPPAPLSSVDQIINSHRCVLNYAFDGVDRAAVQKVEAYATRDDGKTWQLLGEDPDRTSPIEVQLPGDGRYGIVIVISATGRPGQAPAAGEQPDWWVEADTTAPEVTLESATPGVGDDAGLLILKWHVSDKNLKPDAVEFAWSSAPEGPWQTIAKGLRAEGLYRWQVPREAGSKAYLKIEAQDKAGNIGRAATAQPVPVEVNRPRAKVLGINPAAMKQ